MFNRSINTNLSSNEIFKIFSKEKNCVFLDSNTSDRKLSQYSIIAFDPFLKFESKGDKCKIITKNEENIMYGNPLDFIQELMDKYNEKKSGPCVFNGGAIGYIAYDLGFQIESIPDNAYDDMNILDVALNFYYGGIVINHLDKTVMYSDYDLDSYAKKRFEYILAKIADKKENVFEKNFRLTTPIKPNMTKDEYLESLRKIKRYIKQGDIYQVNMTQRFEAKFKGNPLFLYEKLRQKNPAPFCAYLDLDEVKILSTSPERFIEVRDRKIITRPIKGTMPRGKTEKEDRFNKEILKESEKDHAELLMIVDLERNDLGRVAKIGSVKVPELFTIETYETVFHLVATVEAELREDINLSKLIRNVFPGGSITGAPKIRAMEIIDEIEPTKRNIYTGSIGYFDFAGDLDLNIVIRTIVIKDDNLQFQLGGGIVWDSDEESEYQETLDKGKALFEVLESKYENK